MERALSSLFLTLLFAVCAAQVHADPPAVSVVVDAGAPPLEQFAARELCGYLSKLFTLNVAPSNTAAADAGCVFIVGADAARAEVTRRHHPPLSDQGIAIASASLDGRTTTIIGGGSPPATLWAVYALAQRWGVRPLLHGDVLPPPRSFEPPQTLDVIEEPLLRVRQWRLLNEHAMGPISWGIADDRPLIDQLAKLRVNRLLLYIWPGQPFLPLTYKGITQTSGTLFFGHRYPITDDMVGRSLFGRSDREFWNPDLPLPGGDPRALTQAAVKHVQSLIDYARQRGMQCVMPATLTEFPREFRPLLEHTHPVDMNGTPTIGPGPDAALDDPALTGLARAVLDTTIRTYPGVDYIALDMPEWRAWTNRYEQAWKDLDARHHVAAVRSLDDVLAAARHRADYPGGPDRAVNEVKADLVALDFYDRLISEPQFAASGKKFVMSTVAEELFPILPRDLPAGSETLNFVDYTPSRIVKRRAALKGIPAKQIPSVLIYTLHDDNVGVLPQLTTHALAELTHDLREQGWAGFSTRYWLVGDHDPCVAYLARAAWDANATVDDVYRDQVRQACGEAAVADMMTVFREVEAATETLEWHGLGLTFTVPGMMMKHWTADPLDPELKTVVPHYQAARDAATRALAKSTPAGRPYVQCWIGRLDFGIAYLDAIDAVRAAGKAEAQGDRATTLREAERALRRATDALTAYAGVARDRSDKGAIAVMNEYVIRPLRAKVESLKQATPSAR